MKHSWVRLAIASIALSPIAWAAESSQSAAKVNAAPSNTEQQLQELRERMDAIEKQDIGTTRSVSIGTSEVFGIGSTQYNDVLYINDFGLNTDLNLLHERRFIHSYFGGFKNIPRIMLSGNASGTVGRHTNPLPIDESDGQEYMKASIELDLTAYANEDWLGYIQIEADAFGDGTELLVDQGFVTYGNLDKRPIYITAGYQYLPFGSYITSFITNTLVRDVGRTQAPALTGGYVFTRGQWNFNSSIFWFDGDVQDQEQARLNEWGLNAQVRNEKIGPWQDMAVTFGASYINNIASSNGIESALPTDVIDKYVQALDVRAQFEKGPFTIFGEYLQSLEYFSKANLTQTTEGHSPDGVKPEAAHIEASYSFDVLNLPTELSLAYDQTIDSLAFEIPESQYGASYQLTAFTNTLITFEYLHKVDYGTDESTTFDGAPLTQGTGKEDNMFQIQLNVFF